MASLNHTQQKFKLNTGDSIPAVGLGTWQSPPGQVREAVKIALQKGYRHIDTAFAYGNEKEVGEGIKDSGVPREQIWITTKLDNPYHKRVEEGISSSLKSLDIDYVVSAFPVSSGDVSTKRAAGSLSHPLAIILRSKRPIAEDTIQRLELHRHMEGNAEAACLGPCQEHRCFQLRHSKPRKAS
jgi:diketogulonate reductase-like aldo/keto reductase